MNKKSKKNLARTNLSLAKKIKKYIPVMIGISILMPFLVWAQSVSNEEQIINQDLPQVVINKISLNSVTVNAGEKITGSFIIQNQSSQAVSDLRYKMRLFEKPIGDTGKGMIDNTPRVPIDTQVSSEVISLNYLEEKTINFSYTVPQNLISEEHLFMIELDQATGNMLNWETAKINITNGSNKYISISDSAVIVDNQKYGAQEGVNIDLGKNVQAYLKFNNSTGLTNFKTQTVVYYRDPLLNKITEETKDLTVKKGENEITFDLPKIDKPGGSYLAVVKLLDSASNFPLSSEAEFRWVVKGVSAKILSVTLDSFHKDEQSKILPFLINYTGPADNSDGGQGILSVEIKDSDFFSVSASEVIYLTGIKNKRINIDLSKLKNISNLTAFVKIEKNGDILDEYSFIIKPDIYTKFTEENLSSEIQSEKSFFSVINFKKIALGISFIILVLALVLIIIKRKKDQIATWILLLAIFSVSIMFGLNVNKDNSNLISHEVNADTFFEVFNDYGASFNSLSVNYDGSKLMINGSLYKANINIFAYFTDEPIDFSKVTGQLNWCQCKDLLRTVRGITLPNSVHGWGFTMINPIPKRSNNNELFQGNSRYVYVVASGESYSDCSKVTMYAIAHVKLPAPSFAVSDFFYYGFAINSAAYILDWDYPQANSLYTQGSSIRFKGALGSKTCSNYISNLYAKTLKFVVSQEDLDYNIIPYSLGGKVVDPQSISALNYTFMPGSINASYYYDVTFKNNFPGLGTLGTNPEVFPSGQLKVYLLAYSNDNYITLIADAPINYTAPTRTLTIEKPGTGSGIVTSSPTGIDCGTTCSASFTKDSDVTLSASPAVGSTFTSWSSNCTPVAGEPTKCVVKMSENKTVTANFDTCVPNGNYECLKYNTSNSCSNNSCGNVIITRQAVCYDSCRNVVSNSFCGSSCVNETQTCPSCSNSWKEVSP